MGHEKPPERDPIENAEDLARLAARAPDPAIRLWCLEWAQAFQRLARFREAERGDRADDGPSH